MYSIEVDHIMTYKARERLTHTKTSPDNVWEGCLSHLSLSLSFWLILVAFVRRRALRSIYPL